MIELKQWDASQVIVSVLNQIAEEAAKLFNEGGYHDVYTTLASTTDDQNPALCKVQTTNL